MPIHKKLNQFTTKDFSTNTNICGASQNPLLESPLKRCTQSQKVNLPYKKEISQRGKNVVITNEMISFTEKL